MTANDTIAAYLSVKQTAQRLGCCPRTVSNLIRQGRLEAARITEAGRWYIPSDALDRLMMDGTGKAAQAERHG